jgi:EmrB/QacA subfamily drug resistance transporter
VTVSARPFRARGAAGPDSCRKARSALLENWRTRRIALGELNRQSLEKKVRRARRWRRWRTGERGLADLRDAAAGSQAASEHRSGKSFKVGRTRQRGSPLQKGGGGGETARAWARPAVRSSSAATFSSGPVAIGRELHFAETSLLWVVTAYGLAYGGFLLLGGRAADLLGRRRILMTGLGLFTAASLGAGLAGSEAFLIAMRALQGLGAAMLIPAALSSVRNMFAEGAERNKALGIWGALGAGGASVGIILGGLLTRYVGWQYVFFINVPVGAAALLLAPRLVPESRLDTARRYDLFGAVTVTAGLVLLVYAISQAPVCGWGATRTVALLAVSAVLLGAFLAIESRVEAPLLPLRIFRLRTLAGSNVAGLLLGASFYAFIFIGTLYMQQVLGYSPLKGGLTWLVASLASIAFAGVSQLLVTRGSVKLVMALGMTLIGVGILWATQMAVHGHFWANMFGPLFVVGTGTAFAFIPISIGALTGVAEHEAGLASGLIYTSQELGGAIGIAIASSVAATHYKTLLHGGDSVHAALTGGFQQAFWILGAIAMFAVPAIFALIRRDQPETTLAPTAIGEPQPAIAGTK